MENLVFAASDGSTGFEYYITNGTTITQLGDLNPGNNDSYGNPFPFGVLGQFAQIGTSFIVTANDGTAGVELFSSDGTVAGTTRLNDVNFGPGSSNPDNYQMFNGELYFTATTANNGTELWSTDGTSGDTAIVRDIRPGTFNSNPEQLEVVNGRMVFVADDGTSGAELWSTDGTVFGTSRLTDINPGGGSSNITELSGDGSNLLGDKLFFGAQNGTNGNELWVTDGTSAGTMMVKNINPAGGSFAGDFTAFNGLMYFSATDGATNGRELWVTDGTDAGTQLVENLNPGAGNSSPSNLMVLGNKLLFTADNGTSGSELWVTDGTPGAATLLRDINGGGGSSTPFDLVKLGNNVIFSADDGSTGRELYITDGTTVGTKLLSDIAPGAFVGSNPSDLTVVGDSVFFSATTATHGTELWKTDGTTGGTMRVSDIDPGTDSSTPQLLGVFNSAPVVTPPNPGTLNPINGTAGDDTALVGTAANVIIAGGAGTDTVKYTLARSQVVENVLANGDVQYTLPGSEMDTLRNVERVELTDGAYIYDLDADAAQTYRLYSAALARAPDEAGLRFWDTARDNGFTFDQLSQAFVDSTEFNNLFGGNAPSSEQYIDALYTNVLGRVADAPGRAFWVDSFDNGVSRADMLEFFSESPENMTRNADNYDDGFFVVG